VYASVGREVGRGGGWSRDGGGEEGVTFCVSLCLCVCGGGGGGGILCFSF
jgi:hypothetical protein